MATSEATTLLANNEIKAVTIVTPADGPSLPTAPAEFEIIK